MHQRSLVVRFLVLCVGMLAPAAAAAPPAGPGASPYTKERTPKLTVVIAIDQCRGDYLYRFRDLFLPAQGSDNAATMGGFNFLMERGAYFSNARHVHFPHVTAPGHATILTGASPSRSGIVGNEWWDVRARQEVNAVSDPGATAVLGEQGGRAGPAGPRNLVSTTVGDELKLASAGHAKVISIAMKDRGAILLGGHAADLALWFNYSTGAWMSSTAYCRDGKLPDWVEALNKEQLPLAGTDKVWTPSMPAETLAARTMPLVQGDGEAGKGFGKRFPHRIPKGNFGAFSMSPASIDYVFQSAERAIEAGKLGSREVPDLLAISLSTNDGVGHAFGPNSPEVLEITLATDRALAAFLSFLDAHIPGGISNVAIALSADHGVVPIPSELASPQFNISAGHFTAADITGPIAAALTARFGDPGPESWFAMNAAHTHSGAFMDGSVYLNPDAIASAISSGKTQSRRDIERVACDAVNEARIPGIYQAFGRTQIMEGAIADNATARNLAHSIYPARSGDIIVVHEQKYLPGPSGNITSHGSPYIYDAHVPVVIYYPALIRPGVYMQEASPLDIAPTLSQLLHIEYPSGCEGRPLFEAFLTQPDAK